MSSEKRTEDRDLDWEVMGTGLKMGPSFGCVMVLGGCGADIPREIKVCGELSLTWWVSATLTGFMETGRTSNTPKPVYC